MLKALDVGCCQAPPEEDFQPTTGFSRMLVPSRAAADRRRKKVSKLLPGWARDSVSEADIF